MAASLGGLTCTCGTQSCCTVQARQVNAEVIIFIALSEISPYFHHLVMTNWSGLAFVKFLGKMVIVT